MNRTIEEAVVIVVEDDPLNAILIRKLLQIAGVEQLVICESGHELRQALKELPRVDLILLDLRMPDEDGYMVLQSLREMPELAETKVVAATANVMPDDILRAEEAGFDGFMGKPFDFDRFRTQINRILRGERVWEPR